jgi:hypothetical protein
MPEPTPTTDTGGKKLNKTGIILIAAGGAVVAYLIYKKKQESAGSNPYTNQAFIPVTGENVAGAGAPFTGAGGGSGGGSGSGEFISLLEQSQKENQQTMLEFLKNEQQERAQAASQQYEREAASRQSERELFRELFRGSTGGGAPSSGQVNTNGGQASPPSGGSNAAPPPPPAPVVTGGGPQPPSGNGCPSNRPYRSSRGCYSLRTCPNGCQGHDYGGGTVECQQGESRHGNCHW